MEVPLCDQMMMHPQEMCARIVGDSRYQMVYMLAESVLAEQTYCALSQEPKGAARRHLDIPTRLIQEPLQNVIQDSHMCVLYVDEHLMHKIDFNQQGGISAGRWAACK